MADMLTYAKTVEWCNSLSAHMETSCEKVN